jgi:hypothetical protein
VRVGAALDSAERLPVNAGPDYALVDAVACRVVELLREEGLVAAPSQRYVTAGELAQILGITEDWVRRNRRYLGAVRVGKGPRGRLRFDLAAVETALSADGGSGADGSGPGSGPAPRRRRRERAAEAGRLPVREVKVSALPERTPRRGNARGPGP